MTANKKIPGSYLGVLTSRIMALTIFSHVPIPQKPKVPNCKRRQAALFGGWKQVKITVIKTDQFTGLKPHSYGAPENRWESNGETEKLSSGKPVRGQVKPDCSVNTSH